MPAPVSATATSIPSAVARALTVIEPVGVNLTALEMRLMTTWMSRSRWPSMLGRSG
jgi:hypothetical protein